MGGLESRLIQQVTENSTKRISNRILQSSGSSNDHSEEFSYMKWPIGIYMILISIPLGLKGEMWFHWLHIPLGVLIGCSVNRQIYSAVAQHVVMNDKGWQVAWLAFAIILSMIFGIMMHCFKRFGSALLFAYVAGLATSLVLGIINTILTHQMEKWIATIILFSAMGIGFVLGLFFIDYLIIIGTACSGGYNFVAGIGTLCGQFPIKDSNQAVWIFY